MRHIRQNDEMSAAENALYTIICLTHRYTSALAKRSDYKTEKPLYKWCHSGTIMPIRAIKCKQKP